MTDDAVENVIENVQKQRVDVAQEEKWMVFVPTLL